MQKFDFNIAEDMDKALNSAENKEMFSASAMLEKLAFKRVSEEDAVTEIEAELEVQAKLHKTASDEECKCGCNKHKKEDCDCSCHNGKHSSASRIVNTLLQVSADLDAAGFEKLAATSLLMVDRLISEAKAKKSDKKSKESKESDKSKSKSKGKKMDMKDRMKKMREMQKGKKSKKDSKKSSDSKK